MLTGNEENGLAWTRVIYSAKFMDAFYFILLRILYDFFKPNKSYDFLEDSNKNGISKS